MFGLSTFALSIDLQLHGLQKLIISGSHTSLLWWLLADVYGYNIHRWYDRYRYGWAIHIVLCPICPSIIAALLLIAIAHTSIYCVKFWCGFHVEHVWMSSRYVDRCQWCVPSAYTYRMKNVKYGPMFRLRSFRENGACILVLTLRFGQCLWAMHIVLWRIRSWVWWLWPIYIRMIWNMYIVTLRTRVDVKPTRRQSTTYCMGDISTSSCIYVLPR